MKYFNNPKKNGVRFILFHIFALKFLISTLSSISKYLNWEYIVIRFFFLVSDIVADRRADGQSLISPFTKLPARSRQKEAQEVLIALVFLFGISKLKKSSD